MSAIIKKRLSYLTIVIILKDTFPRGRRGWEPGLVLVMSSWLSGGISQFSSLTDQISSFTKEVITESTQEIEGGNNVCILISSKSLQRVILDS